MCNAPIEGLSITLVVGSFGWLVGIVGPAGAAVPQRDVEDYGDDDHRRQEGRHRQHNPVVCQVLDMWSSHRGRIPLPTPYPRSRLAHIAGAYARAVTLL